MKTKRTLQAILLASLFIGSTMAYADDDLDVTMRMVPPGVTLPDAVTKVITLPSQATDAAAASSHAQQGLDTANAARQNVQLPQVTVPPLPDQAKGHGRP